MLRIRLKFRYEALWLIAAVVVSTLEIYAATARDRGWTVGAGDAAGNRPLTVVHEVRPIGVTSASGNGTILVVGNPAADSDGDVEVVLRATRIPQNGGTSGVQGAGSTSPFLTPQRHPIPESSARSLDSSAVSTEIARQMDFRSTDLKRVYFLPAQMSAASGNDRHTPVPCGLTCETPRVRIFLDQRLPPGPPLSRLVNAVAAAAESELGEVVEALAGRVRDVDHDGHLAIVITPEVARVGGGRTPVDGLTRPTDFHPGLDRPHGNCSDVIFLSSTLVPGNQLRAVLAHEWCHAASFSRRSEPLLKGTQTAQDDWLNEATAHLVEVRASGTDRNVAHRIRNFLANPGQSPLVVRNYCRPEFWRHDGCRGAGYLFLESCLAVTDENFLTDLLDHDDPGMAGLEATFGQSFENLFFRWTMRLGQHLASDGATAIPGVACQDLDSPPRLAHRTWRLSGDGRQTMTVRLRSSCAEFVRVETDDNATWQLSLLASGADSASLQTSLIPVAGKSSQTCR